METWGTTARHWLSQYAGDNLAGMQFFCVPLGRNFAVSWYMILITDINMIGCGCVRVCVYACMCELLYIWSRLMNWKKRKRRNPFQFHPQPLLSFPSSKQTPISVSSRTCSYLQPAWQWYLFYDSSWRTWHKGDASLSKLKEWRVIDVGCTPELVATSSTVIIFFFFIYFSPLMTFLYM